jgi:glycosyltransferase involved in cell wall biosynthesis
MNIGIDARELAGQVTGTGRYLRSLLRHWCRSDGDRLFVYVVDAPSSRTALPDAALAWRAVGGPRVRGLVWEQRLLPRAARSDDVDVFFSPAYHCPLRLARPRVTTVHDLSFFSQPHDFTLLDGLRRRLLVAASVRASRAVLAVSRFTRAELLRRFPDAAGRVFVVPHGADDDLPPAPERGAARERLRLAGPFILWVGSIFNRRCLVELLTAAAWLRRRWPELVVEVVGDNRTHPRLDVSGLARRLGLGDRLRLSGFVDEAGLALRYAAADAVVQLSDYEGFGMPAIEAMARGVPVVASDRPALSEVVGAAAARVNPRDPLAIAQTLARVIADPHVAAELRAQGRAHAARFSWQAAAERTLAILHAAAGQ